MELFRVSPYNKKHGAGRAVYINDCTLREGEQTGDAAFSMRDREKIAFALDSACVDRIQMGFAEIDKQAQKEMRDLISQLKHSSTETLITGFTDQWKNHVDNALESNIEHFSVIFRTSPFLLRLLGFSEEQAEERVVKVISYAREQGAPVIGFTPTDATRSELGFLKRICGRALEAGASELVLADTLGVATPEAIKYLVGAMRNEYTDVPIGVHVHNDFGLALANVIASLEAGASMVDTCINGMGDRAGNPSLDEVVVSTAILYGYTTNVKMENLCGISQIVSDICGFALPVNKPIVGSNAFTQKLDVHVRAALQEPLAFQPFLPQLVGNKSRVAIGKGTGLFALRSRLKDMNMEEELSDEVLNNALSLIWRMSEEKKRSLNDEEINSIIDRSKKTTN